jgi:hypothetical protein
VRILSRIFERTLAGVYLMIVAWIFVRILAMILVIPAGILERILSRLIPKIRLEYYPSRN